MHLAKDCVRRRVATSRGSVVFSPPAIGQPICKLVCHWSPNFQGNWSAFTNQNSFSSIDLENQGQNYISFVLNHLSLCKS